MLALRRASLPLRKRGLSIWASGAACCPDSERAVTRAQDKAGIFDSPELASDRCHLSFNNHVSADPFLFRRSLSSQAGARSSGDEGNSEDVETADSVKAVGGSNAQDDNEDELISEPDFSEDDGVAEPAKNELDMSDTEAELIDKAPSRERAVSALFKVIADSHGLNVRSALDKWVEEGNELDTEDISSTMFSLCKYRMYGKALQLSEWLEESKKIEFLEKDYSSRVDLIAKLYGPERAERYIGRIPVSFRGELIYGALLANYVRVVNVRKAEEVFDKIKDLQLPITSFSCNQMLLLYKRIDNNKIADVLVLMEKENVKPSLFTYRLLIDIKGRQGDITGMEQILETMKAGGVEPDRRTNSMMVWHYSSAGLKEKAEAILKQMEGDSLNENRDICQNLIQLYAGLGQADEVKRVWKVCESNPSAGECIAAIEAWGKLNNIEEAEAIFEKMLKVLKKPTSLHYNALLKVYSTNRMLTKGKDLIKRMADSGCRIGPFTWDSLVKLYLDAGEVEKADSVLQKAAEHNKVRPLFVSYLAIMEQYARRGDIHNTEKIYHRMRQAGYSPRLRQFQALVKAYVNAKAPFYGVWERMKADNIIPTKGLVGQVALVDAFRKSAITDWLD